MWTRWMVVVLLVAIGCVTTPAPTPAAAPAASAAAGAQSRTLPIPADLAPHIKQSSELGVAIYLQDKVSAIGTDVLRDKVPDFEKRNLAGSSSACYTTGNRSTSAPSGASGASPAIRSR